MLGVQQHLSNGWRIAGELVRSIFSRSSRCPIHGLAVTLPWPSQSQPGLGRPRVANRKVQTRRWRRAARNWYWALATWSRTATAPSSGATQRGVAQRQPERRPTGPTTATTSGSCSRHGVLSAERLEVPGARAGDGDLSWWRHRGRHVRRRASPRLTPRPTLTARDAADHPLWGGVRSPGGGPDRVDRAPWPAASCFGRRDPDHGRPA